MVVKIYYIAVYDINVERVNKVKKIFRQYMIWIQNSVFEGQLTKNEKMKLTVKLRNTIDESEDYIVFYSVRSKKYLEKEIIGEKKTSTEKVI